jgi:hypothetical protein
MTPETSEWVTENLWWMFILACASVFLWDYLRNKFRPKK